MANSSPSLGTPITETTVTVDTVPLRVLISHWKDLYDGNCAYHFEFLSPNGKPTPVSRTGYRSHFLIAERALEVPELENYARDYCRGFLNRGDDIDQMNLFDGC